LWKLQSLIEGGGGENTKVEPTGREGGYWDIWEAEMPRRDTEVTRREKAGNTIWLKNQENLVEIKMGAKWRETETDSTNTPTNISD